MPDSHAAEILSMQLSQDDADWTPTPHGRFLGEVLAERDLVRDQDVLELGGGVGNHTIVMLRKGVRSLVTTEITPQLLATTRRNVLANCLGEPPVEFREADWLDTSGSFDVIVSNPPFCKSGKQNRRYFIDALILDGHKRLRGAGGRLIFVQSSMADLARTLRMLDKNGFDSQVLDQTTGPFRDYYYEDAEFMAEIRDVPEAFTLIDGVEHETLSVVMGTLREYVLPPDAHVQTTGP